MKLKKETKIIIGATALLSAAVGASIATVKMLTDMAIKKDLPKAAVKLKPRLNSALIGDEYYKKASLLSQKLEGKLHNTVHIESCEGLKLYGHVFTAPEQKRVVICMHGWRSEWSFDFGGCADFFLEEGCTLILPEQRCHGKSEGEFIGFGVYERFDCLEWINYAKNLFPDTPIYLCGVSMGATTVMMASGLQLPDCVKGIIADCGFTSPRGIWKHVMKNNLKMSEKLAYPIANFYVNKKAGYDGEGASTVEALKNCKVPVLFVHGDADTFVPHSMTLENFDACASDKTLLIVEGAGHGLSYFFETEKYQKHIKDFFNKND